MRGLIGIGSAVCMALATPSVSSAQNREQVRQDVLSLLMGGVFVPGIAAYCNKYVSPNAELVYAAVAWNKRNDEEMRLVLRALEWSGGMSGEERKQLEVDALRLVKRAVAEDDGAICSSMVAHLTEGLIDLDKWEDTAPAYERLRRHFQ